MFSFLDEIIQKTGLPFDVLNNGFRIINFSNKSIFIEGFLNILIFEANLIKIKLKKGVIEIEGEGLKIKNMDMQTMIITGNILKLEMS